MTQKLRLTPDMCYVLGAHSCSTANENAAVQMSANEERFLERFIKIAMSELMIEPNKLIMDKTEGAYTAKFYNSKIRKFLDRSVERIERILRYRNAYSANYLAGIFDQLGGHDRRGIYMYNAGTANVILMERLGFHTSHERKVRIKNEDAFITFIGTYSLRLQSIVHMPGNERDLH